MKTKEEVKKSRSREVEESSSAKLGPAPSPPAVGDVGAGSSTPESAEQSENVYENKGGGQEVDESRC